MFHLSAAPSPPIMTPYPPPLHTVYSIIIHIGKGGGELTRKGLRGNSSQSRSKISTWRTVSPVYELDKTLVKDDIWVGVFIVN